MDQNSISSRIEAIRKKYGSDLVILGHHYQADEVVEHVDIVGDSLELARRIPDIEAEISGGVTLETIRVLALACPERPADFISVGRITHSAPSADFSMKMERGKA